ncbi:ASMT methyltransferase, partial [Polypterus senegalus]
MSSSSEAEYPRRILDYMEGFLVSKTLFAACELGVFDLLSQSKQPMRAAEIAHRLKTNVDGMERLLAACVGLELLHAEMIEGEERCNKVDSKQKKGLRMATLYTGKNRQATELINRLNLANKYGQIKEEVESGRPEQELVWEEDGFWVPELTSSKGARGDVISGWISGDVTESLGLRLTYRGTKGERIR